MINIENYPKVIKDYRDAKARLILLDYDGTLVPFDMHPDLTRPSVSARSLLQKMAADSSNSIVLISGRDRENLEKYWGDLAIVLAAEHGAFFKHPQDPWENLFPYVNTSWLSKAESCLRALSFHYDGSFIESKLFSVAWHYRSIAQRVEQDKRQILAAIRALPFQQDFTILDSEHTLELRALGVNKGSAIARWVSHQQYDFVMAIGDSQTDEDIFKLFDQNEYTIKVGNPSETHANFYLKSQEQVLPFLHHLTGIKWSGSSEKFKPNELAKHNPI